MSNDNRQIPRHLIPNTPYKFKWSNTIAMGFDRVNKPRLFHALNLLSTRAKMAIGALVTEYIIFSLADECDIRDAQQRVTAAWVSVIDPNYVSSLDITMIDDHHFHNREYAAGAVEMSLVMLDSIYYRYAKGDYYLADTLTKQLAIARHITKSKKQFDLWLEKTLKGTAKNFPYSNNYNEKLERFEYMEETPVSQSFFCFDEPFNIKINAEQLDVFLQSINIEENSYLHNCNVLLTKGMVAPYRYLNLE